MPAGPRLGFAEGKRQSRPVVAAVQGFFDLLDGVPIGGDQRQNRKLSPQRCHFALQNAAPGGADRQTHVADQAGSVRANSGYRK